MADTPSEGLCAVKIQVPEFLLRQQQNKKPSHPRNPCQKDKLTKLPTFPITTRVGFILKIVE